MNSSVTVSTKPHLVIRPTSGWQTINIAEIWQFRDLLFGLAIRDVKLRYKQTALGAIWVVLQPIISAGVFTFVFGSVAKMKSDGPYFAFSFVGLLAWGLFSGTVTKASGSLVSNSHLVSKVYFPRLILPFYTVLGTLQDTGISLIVFIFAAIGYHIVPTVAILLTPVFAILLLTAGMGVGLICASLTVHYRDVSVLLNFMITFLMWLCPVAYSARDLKGTAKALYSINPVATLIEGFRWCLMGQGHVNFGNVAYAAVASVVLLLVGAMLFRRMEKQFADVI